MGTRFFGDDSVSTGTFVKGEDVVHRFLRGGPQRVPLGEHSGTAASPPFPAQVVSMTQPPIFSENVGIFQDEVCKPYEWAQLYESEVRRPAAIISDIGTDVPGVQFAFGITQ